MKNKHLLFVSVLFLLIQSCQHSEEFSTLETNDYKHIETMPKAQLNAAIFDLLKKQGAMEWNDLNDEQLASAFLLADEKLITVAWDYESRTNMEKEAIINFIAQSEGKETNDKEVFIEINDKLKLMDVRIEKVETLLGVRQLSETAGIDVYYNIFTEEELEKLARKYESFLKEQENLNAPRNSDCAFGNIQPSSDAACNHEIPAAWAARLSGDGIKVGVIDGALNSSNSVFGSGGNGGNSARTFQRESRYKSPWWYWGSYASPLSGNSLINGHGTQMMQIIGNPPGSSAGAAYDADLYFVRSTGLLVSVLIDAPAENTVGVRRAFERLASRSDVKIISMSQGGLITWSGVRNAVRLCNDNGKMIFMAGGTFPLGELVADLIFGDPGNFTLFPASLSFNGGSDFSYVFSATGIEGTSSIEDASWCTQCFGRADFVVEFTSGGSSSESTALTAGMAALIWANEPHLNRAEVLTKMAAASDRFLTNPHPDFGYGRINMQQYVDNEGL